MLPLPTLSQVSKGVKRSVSKFKPKSVGSRKGVVFFKALLIGRMEGGAERQDVGL